MKRHVVKTITDYGTHSYSIAYEYDDSIHCPNCGVTNVWVETGFGDYYEGVEHLCVNCVTSFTMPSINTNGDEYMKSILDIREYIKQNQLK